MILKKGWKERFAATINHEIIAINQNIFYSKKERRKSIDSMKNVIYLMGISIDKNKYQWASGFDRFCDDMNMPFMKGR